MRTAHSARQNCNGTFQCRSINEPPQSPKSVVGRIRAGFAQLGVSRRGCGFVVCASRSLRGAKKHRTAALFCVLVASHLPARTPIVGLICAMGSVALPASDRRNSTSVISRLAPGGCWVVIKKKLRFFLCCASAFGSFLIPLFGTNFYTRETPDEQPNRAKQLTWKNGEIGSTSICHSNGQACSRTG